MPSSEPSQPPTSESPTSEPPTSEPPTSEPPTSEPPPESATSQSSNSQSGVSVSVGSEGSASSGDCECIGFFCTYQWTVDPDPAALGSGTWSLILNDCFGKAECPTTTTTCPCDQAPAGWPDGAFDGEIYDAGCPYGGPYPG